MFETMNEALDWLYQQKKLKKREDLSRMERCIQLLGIKMPYFKIHIAGTNGKGSTACYLERLLELKGWKVGLFTSPYILRFNERIQINREEISDEAIVTILNHLFTFSKAYFETYSDTIPFFELTFLMALLYFQEQKIDAAVIECGLGGRLDATNVLDTDVQVITNIGYDHMKQLGNTLEEIAWHKLGITESGKPCFTTVDDSLISYFEAYAKENQIDLHWIYPMVENIKLGKTLTFQLGDTAYETNLNAYYQAYNASLAISVIKYLYPTYPKDFIVQAIHQVFWPGRFEEILPSVLLDGAHNIPAMKALSLSLLKKYPHQKFHFVFTALHDKAIEEMIGILDELDGVYSFTTIEDKRASNIDSFQTLTSHPYQLYENYEEAIKNAITHRQNEVVVITGSLHFISLARDYILKNRW